VGEWGGPSSPWCVCREVEDRDRFPSGRYSSALLENTKVGLAAPRVASRSWEGGMWVLCRSAAFVLRRWGSCGEKGVGAGAADPGRARGAAEMSLAVSRRVGVLPCLWRALTPESALMQRSMPGEGRTGRSLAGWMGGSEARSGPFSLPNSPGGRIGCRSPVKRWDGVCSGQAAGGGVSSGSACVGGGRYS